MLKNYKELKVWEKSYRLVLEVYKIAEGFPKDERFGLTSQIRRSAVSIPSNIAEGYGRRTVPDYIKFLYVAYGSICELETQIMLSGDLNYIEKQVAEKIIEAINEVERMLKALIHSLENRSSSPEPLDPLDPRPLEP